MDEAWENETLKKSTKESSFSAVKPRHATQYFAALAGCLGAMGSGTIMGFSAPAGPQLVPTSENDRASCNSCNLTLTSSEYVWFSSIPNLAAAIIGPFAGLAINTIGRKGTMLTS
ncbi:hypothetical protein SK128_000598, partial [Halocaridina rubra]